MIATIRDRITKDEDFIFNSIGYCTFLNNCLNDRSLQGVLIFRKKTRVPDIGNNKFLRIDL